jgi:murein L,D-transpeptidase YcbB/YkuD
MRSLRNVIAAALFIGCCLTVNGAGTASAATPVCDSLTEFMTAAVPYNTTSNNVNCHLVQGNYGSGVYQLQFSMRYCYGENIALDGDFGPETRSALIRTQRKAGTPADGEYGPNTRRAMRHEPASGQGPCVRVY